MVGGILCNAYIYHKLPYIHEMSLKWAKLVEPDFREHNKDSLTLQDRQYIKVLETIRWREHQRQLGQKQQAKEMNYGE